MPQSNDSRERHVVSNKAITWAYDLDLKGTAKPVLVALADFADEAGTCYPGQDRLAHMTGLSKASVRRALERLEELGLIAREHRYDQRGYRTSDRYRLALDSQVLVLTEPSSHSALKAESNRLVLTLQPPSAHSEHITISRTPIDPSGGAQAPDPTPVPWCKRHAATEGTDRPCAACTKARHAWELSLVTADQEQQWHAVTKQVKHIPGLCDAHRQPEATCEACIEDRKRGIA